MRDLELSRRIDDGIVTPDDLAPLAMTPLGGRGVFLGRLAALAAHEDAALRTAALACLAGARGMRAVRAIVARLDDADESVRAAAVDALRVTAREAPHRYAHALFHPRVDVRRMALHQVPSGIAEVASYLRADPECADLIKDVPWPDPRLPLVFDLHATGMLGSAEMIRIVAWSPPHEMKSFLEREHGRMESEVDAYLEQCARDPVLVPAPRTDAIDQLWRAIAEAGAYERELEMVIVTATLAKKKNPIGRRMVASLLSHLARDPRPELWGALATLEPRSLDWACFDRTQADAVAAALIRFKWPVRPLAAQALRLLNLAWVKRDLALAAAIAGLLPAKRLHRLAEAFGEPALLDALVADDRGWAQICHLPQEKPPHDQRWLAQIERTRPARTAELAGIALGIFSGKRLEAFIDQLQRRSRPLAFIALVRRTALEADDPRILTAAAMMSTRIDRAGWTEVLAALLEPGTPQRELLVAIIVIRALADNMVKTVATALSDAALLRVVEIVDTVDGEDALPRSREVALAEAASLRKDPALLLWSAKILAPATSAPTVVVPPVRAKRTLTEDEQREIVAAPLAKLEEALAPALGSPTAGLVDALSRRAAHPSVAACAALLGCVDPMPEVAAQLDRFAERTAKFESALDNAAAAAWGTGRPALSDLPLFEDSQLPALVHARLWRWEAHTEQLAKWIARFGSAHGALTAIAGLEGWLAVSTMWRGIAEVLVFARYRDRTRFFAEGTEALAKYAAERVDQHFGLQAARVCVALVEGGAVPITSIRSIILDRTPDADADTRDQLARLIRLDGMPTPPRTIEIGITSASLIEKIRSTKDLDALERYCADARFAVVQEAVLMMLTMGEHGQLRLAHLLARLAELPAPVPLLASIALWDSPAALDIARTLAANANLPAEWQFHLCLGLGDIQRAIAAIHVPGTSWFRRTDWDALTKQITLREAALALVDAPHHHAYARSVEVLLEDPHTNNPDLRSALHRFLEVSSARPTHLRRTVARRLAVDIDDLLGIPILVDELIDIGPGGSSWMDALSRRAGEQIARGVVEAALVGGHGVCAEKRLWEILAKLDHAKLLEQEVAAELYALMLDEAMTSQLRNLAAQHAIGSTLAHSRLLAVAEVFAWGVRRGIELTGRLMRFHLTSKEKDLGHTYLDGNQVFVSALPMLRGEPHGVDVVEGLVLHELGHHAYHRGEQAQALWKQAHAEGIGHMLNLIADEHLERNLRALDASYGDRLKRLDAYAFQHAPQELRLHALLETLRGSAASALTGTELGVAFDELCVRLRRGAILTQLEKSGHPLARFARALRMGLGNRHGDPLVGAALDLCGRDLRKHDMQGLYNLTKQVAAMFGGAVSVAKVFGGPEGLGFGERDEDVFAGGIDDDVLQREVERILDPKRGKGPRKPGEIDRLQINVNPDEDFERITNVRKIKGSPEDHRRLVAEVNRHSIRLRTHLDELGLRWLPVKARTKGHALDRGRLRSLITHGDPRILQARTPTRRTDLFLGTIIDCSGSMSAGNNLERARKFAVLIAEAVRPLPGVEARFFGFTDSTIYDAGDSANCNVTALRSEGGNNDAAALYHAANVALSSRKRARVLVMISDGLPTECSVAALRGLVTTLTKRKGIVCAQVAVRALEEECFPNYVVLDDAAIETAVAKFGRMIGDLTRKALSA
ncbi:MAG: hypothetical protein AB7L94_06880 [Kofleriaceae bacterium]